MFVHDNFHEVTHYFKGIYFILARKMLPAFGVLLRTLQEITFETEEFLNPKLCKFAISHNYPTVIFKLWKLYSPVTYVSKYFEMQHNTLVVLNH